jgi:hypothetical protein
MQSPFSGVMIVPWTHLKTGTVGWQRSGVWKMRILFGLIIGLLITDLALFAQDAPRHSVFIAGPTFTGILDEDGKEVWNAGRSGARDGSVLENGNVLICWMDEVRELTRDKKETVFHYKLSKENQELGTAQRLADGKTLITELGAKPVAMSAVAFRFSPKPTMPICKLGWRASWPMETISSHTSWRSR